MNRVLALVLGAVLTAAGALFTLQGAGVIGGSAMSGKTLWVVLGPIIVLAGLFLLLRGGRGRAGHDDLV